MSVFSQWCSYEIEYEIEYETQIKQWTACGRGHNRGRPSRGEMDDPVDGDVWDDFGQKVDLTARLREILLNYPEGTSILKELVQNAVRAPSSIPLFSYC